ncbi:zinc carboxypeptidase-like [Pectinophora gossypiella]|uniref:zinc carboxypeptidase-like n=1 Tax=Pectinophora gossypiella TaxID=13191 RepID=UPI00214EBF2C|nr:zinc carboxypeptidase-like [Pectinophora gossypiella]
MNIKHIFLIFTIIAATNAVKKSYEGYKVYKVIPKTEDDVKILNIVQELGIGEFWDDNVSVKSDAKIMVSRDLQNEFLTQMEQAQIEVTEVISDLQKVIDDQLTPAKPKSRFERESFHSMSWDRYYSLSEIHAWLDQLNTSYPNIVQTVTWGRSNENRELKGIIINYHPQRAGQLKAVIEGAVHAREWITPATATWIIKEFLTSNDREVRALAEGFEWHILPVANPDGYSYTFTNNRMWRKNRNTSYNRTCATNVDDDMSNGVDLNRNFDFNWMSIGASNDPCSNTFAGSAGFSEPESRAISNYVRDLNSDGQLIYYLAFHSYTQLVIVPYSHITSADDVLEAENYANMFEIGARSADRLRERFGTTYRVGVSADVMYPMSGTSFDWVKNATDVPVCFLLEFRDLGEYGFLLPPEQIIPNGMEAMDFLLEMDQTTRILGYYDPARSGSNSLFKSLLVLVFSILAALNA